MRVLDLFSGIGGFALGFQRAGFDIMGFCESEEYCRAVLQKHWPAVPCFEDVRMLCRRTWDNEPEDDGGYVECRLHPGEDFGDCACIGTDQFVDTYGAPDVICGGFPCTDISLAAAATASPAGLAGERSGLWREFARIVGELGPRYVVVENVTNVASAGLDGVLGDLAGMRYDAEWFVLPAAAIGAPHRRNRTFIVAYPDSAGLQGTIGAELAREVQRRHDTDPTGSAWIHAASRVLRNHHGVPNRVDRLRAIGNAVTPGAAEAIAAAIRVIDARQGGGHAG